MRSGAESEPGPGLKGNELRPHIGPNMEHLTKTLRTLGTRCEPKHLRPPGYAACDALLDSAFPLTSGQLPVLAPGMSKHAAETIGYPTSSTVSSLYLDLCSILMLYRHDALPPHMITVMSVPTYDEDTMMQIGRAFVKLTGSVQKSGATFITRDGPNWSLTVVYRVGCTIDSLSTYARWSSVDDVVAYLRTDPANGSCLAVCHDDPDSDSAAILGSVRIAAWSIGSTSACGAVFRPAAELPVARLLPVYMHPGSTYMRVVSTAGEMNPVYSECERQVGDTGLYNCMIRGSRTRTGRCWDCQCLHALAGALEGCLQTNPKSRNATTAVSISGVLDSTFTHMYMSLIDQ